jgi:hypothetical protein
MTPQNKSDSSKIFTLWLEFENCITEPTDDPTHDFCNIIITLRNGKQYALNIWTFKYFDTAVRQSKNESSVLFGKFLKPPDLFVERLDRNLIEDVVGNLIELNELNPAWECP